MRCAQQEPGTLVAEMGAGQPEKLPRWFMHFLPLLIWFVTISPLVAPRKPERHVELPGKERKDVMKKGMTQIWEAWRQHAQLHHENLLGRRPKLPTATSSLKLVFSLGGSKPRCPLLLPVGNLSVVKGRYTFPSAFKWHLPRLLVDQTTTAGSTCRIQGARLSEFLHAAPKFTSPSFGGLARMELPVVNLSPLAQLSPRLQVHGS